MFNSAQHPRQNICFFLAQDIDEPLLSQVKDLVDELASLRNWVIGPPRFIYQKAEAKGGDEPIITLGGALEIHDARLPLTIPKDIDFAEFKEVEELVEIVRQFSEILALSIEFYLDAMFIGSIESGILDRTLKVGLLEEWRKRLQ
jgi:hypothetical protein